VIVPQVLPIAPQYFGWLDDERALLVADGVGYVWEPASDRVLAVWSPAELRASLPWDWPSDELARTWRTPFGTDLSRSLDGGALIVRDGESIYERFAASPLSEAVVFSADHRRVAICDETGLTVRELERGRVLARREAPAHACVWEGELIAVMDDAGAEVLRADTLERAIDPIEHVSFAAPSRDGTRLAVVLRGSREGISVIDLATGQEQMHRSVANPYRVRIVGDAVFYSTAAAAAVYVSGVPVMSISGGVLSARGGNVIVEQSEDAEAWHLGPGGVLVRTETGIVLRQPSGATVRPAAMQLAAIEFSLLSDHFLTVTSSGRRWWVDAALSGHVFGACPASIGGWSTRELVGPRLRTFDAHSGAVIGDVTVLSHTFSLHVEGGLLVHEAHDMATRHDLSIFEFPSLRRIGHWSVRGERRRFHDPYEAPRFAAVARDGEVEIADVWDGRVRRMNAHGRILRELPMPGAVRVLAMDRGIAVTGGEMVRLLRWPELTPLGEVEGHLEASRGAELVVCDAEHALRLTIEADALRARALPIRCPASFHYLDRGVLAASTADGVVLVRADDAVLSLLVTVDGDTLVWSGVSDGVTYGPGPVMLRQPTMIADGMIDAPRGASVAEWMAGP
jgi:hypothetical protein